MLNAILNHLGLSYKISEAILGSLRPSWSHLGPSWTPWPLAEPPLQVQGEGVGGWGPPFPEGRRGFSRTSPLDARPLTP
eukprot:444807-Pyramimonas_sp.AAC.1